MSDSSNIQSVDDSTQKMSGHVWFNLTLALLGITGAVWFYFNPTFVPTGAFAFFAPYVVLGSFSIYSVYLVGLYRRNPVFVLTVYRTPELQNFSLFSKILGLLMLIGVLYWLIWINISSVIPGIYTRFVGQQAYHTECVAKSSYTRTWGKALILPNYEPPAFAFRVTKKAYIRVPTRGFETEIRVIESPLGFVVTGIQIY